MGLSASQGRLLLLTARRSDLEYRAQQISQKRLVLSQQLEEVSMEYEDATSNRQMKISLFLNGENDGTNAVNRTSNLTYAALVSGTVGPASPGSAITGIQGYSRTEDQTYSSTTNYRLVSADGAIVVSDVREIPTVMSTPSSSTTTAEEYKNKDGKAITNLYNPKLKTTYADGKIEDKDKGFFGLVADEASELFKALEGRESLKASVDIESGIVKVQDASGDSVYYNLATGDKYKNEKGEEAAPTKFSDTEITLVNGRSKLPGDENIVFSSKELQLEEGRDGHYTLYNDKGSIIQRYIVDDSLKYGSTDVDGSTDGPNYLQDCLRNGKYLLEKGTFDKDTDEGFRWSSVSWDATANISDSYYTEDDDAAKAKYDRLQAQIQSQDKKLELELDNIETQRNAVTTEVESVEKVIKDDIEGTFNAFG